MRDKVEFRYILKVCFFVGCLTFVGHRGYKCFSKYFQKPKGINIEKHFARDYIFPTVTFCYNSNLYNPEITERCNVKVYDYTSHVWIGNGTENYCNNPKKFNEKVIWQLDDFKLKDVSVNNQIEIDRNQTEWWTQVSFYQQKCWSLKIPKGVQKEGINQLYFRFAPESPKLKFYLHQPESIYTDMPKLAEPIILNPHERISISIKHEIVRQLDFDGGKCIQDDNYSFDDCVNRKIFEKSMNEIGCTTVFGPDLSNVCTNQTKARAVKKVFNRMTMDMENGEFQCFYPCKYIEIMANKMERKILDSDFGAGLTLNFMKFVTVTTSFYSYTELELLAEFGGYVGLFLGFSVFDLSTLITEIHQKLFP